KINKGILMDEEVTMPKMSDTMEEGVIAKWHIKVGDTVSSGYIIAEVETDKATMDFESYQEGTLLYIGPKEGDAVPIDAVIVILGEEGEEYEHLLKESSQKDEEPDTQSIDSEDSTEDSSSEDGRSTYDLGVTVITMPILRDTMTEGVISQWNVKVGDSIKSDDAIADVETDKATMEVTAYAEGTLIYVGPKEAEAVPVNGVIAMVGPE